MSFKDLKEEILDSNIFSEEYYLNKYEDVRQSVLSPIDHFIKIGLKEGRRPSLYFDQGLYLAKNLDVLSSGSNGFIHYIRHGSKEGRSISEGDISNLDKIESSGLFDPDFYLSYYKDAQELNLNPIYHFLLHGFAEGRRPSIEFDPDGYLEINPDVSLSNLKPFHHYIHIGMDEGRSLARTPFNREGFKAAYKDVQDSGLFDINYYLSNNPVAYSSGIDPILYYLVEGHRNYQDPSPLFSSSAYYVQYPHLFASKEAALLHYIKNKIYIDNFCNRNSIKENKNINCKLMNDHKLALARMEATSYFSRYDFSFGPSSSLTHLQAAIDTLAKINPVCQINNENPDVSIIIPIYGQAHFAVSCIESISQQNSRFSMEIIVADDKSPIEHYTNLIGSIPWINYYYNEENLGFLNNCNFNSRKCKGKFIVLLNSDTRVADGWLDELIGSFELFPKAGFVGSKLINGDGSLQEAGAIYWSDGMAWNYGRGKDHSDPRYSFARQVDWVSGASIAVPKTIWDELSGFDPFFQPAYCEDVDLAFRIREKGYEIWFQPLSYVIHFEGMTHGRDETSGIKSYQATNLKRLQQRWKGKLPGVRSGGLDPDREANRSVTKSMLVIDALTHTPDRDAGSAIGWQMLKAYRELGFQQTYFPLHGLRHEGRYTEDYQRLGVEMLYAPFVTNFREFIQNRNSFDYILTHRYNVTQEILDIVRQYAPLSRVIFVPADLHHLRMEREAEVKKDRSLRIRASRAKSEELKIFSEVDCSIPHTFVEKKIIIDLLENQSDNIVVLPWAIDNIETSSDQSIRKNIMYLGGYNHSPNVDAVEFFVNEVLNDISDQLPVDTKFMAVGNAPPAKFELMDPRRIIVTGHVPDVSPYFACSRVFVAPLRFGAGIKGKVIQSLAHGVPVVATSIALEGIGLVDEENCLKADSPEEFGKAVLRLFSEPETWNRIRNSGIEFVNMNFSWSNVLNICEKSLDVADNTWINREETNLKKWIQKNSNNSNNDAGN